MKKIEEHLCWLYQIYKLNDIPKDVYDKSIEVIILLSLQSDGKMPIPSACTGPDNEMFYSWDKEEHHLEANIIPGQPIEWFYRNRKTRQTKFDENDNFPADFVGLLPLFYLEKD